MPPATRNRQRGQPANIDLMEDLENAMPFELAWPSASSSAADLADVGIPMSAVGRIVLQKSKIEQP
jgi:hypothetical protein